MLLAKSCDHDIDPRTYYCHKCKLSLEQIHLYRGTATYDLVWDYEIGRMMRRY